MNNKHLIRLTTAFVCIAAVMGFRDTYFDISRSMDVFSGVYREVNMFYVDEVEPGKLMKTYLENMLKTLDPYTNYFSEATVESSRLENTGKFGGLGMETDTAEGFPIVISIERDKPADKAGIRPGDQILSVDGQSAANKSTDDLYRILRGQPNTGIQLRIRSGTIEKTLSLRREEMTETAVPWYGMADSGIGYINLRVFSETAAADVKKALLDLKKQNPELKGLILDVRDNPGGLLQEAVKISGMFVPQGQLIASTKGKKPEWNTEFPSREQPIDTSLRIVVLTNNRSASASEIVSGSLQDLDRAVIAGNKTFGKGLVQITKNLPYNTVLKVTTAKYYIPSGRCIQAINYAEKNADGSVRKLPDSLKVAFKTRNGRTVYDGGGIDPELSLNEDPGGALQQALRNKKMILRYAIEFCRRNPEKPTASVVLPAGEIARFKQWTTSAGFEFKTALEDALPELDTVLKEEKYQEAAASGMAQLRENIRKWKERCWQTEEQAIARELSREIAGIYFHADGKIRESLRHDEWVKSASALLMNQERYKELLKAGKRQ